MRISDSFADWAESALEVLGHSQGESGLHISAVCPWCGGRKFSVNVETGYWICYRKSCESRDVSKSGNGGGNAAQLYAEVEGTSIHIAKAKVSGFMERASTLTELAERVCPPEHRPEDPEPDNERELPNGFSPVMPQAYPKYLTERGIPFSIARRYKLGTAPGQKWRGRIIIPAYQDGKLQFFQARATDPDMTPKYESPNWSRAGVLLGLDQVPKHSNLVVVVEGPFDVLGLARFGVPAVATLGVNLGAAQLSAFASRFTHVVVMLDGDAQDEARKYRRALLDVVSKVTIARLPDGKDPGSATKGEIRQALKKMR